MKKRIAIFGPPGVGKSTLIKTAAKRGIKIYDFEGFPSQERQKRASAIFKKNSEDTVLFNAADLQPSDFSPDVELVLLLPPKNKYLERLRKRDASVPAKRDQGGPDVYEGFSQNKQLFHRVIEDVADSNKILDKIIEG